MTLEHDITQIGSKIATSTGQLNQIKNSRDRLKHFIAEEKRLTERIEKLAVDIQEMETELAGLEAKIEAYPRCGRHSGM